MQSNLCDHYIDIILNSIMNTNRETFVIVYFFKLLQVFDIWHAKICTQKNCTSIDTHKLEIDM